MEKFNTDESNLIIAGLNMLVKQHGLERPDIYQMAHGIMGKLKQAAEAVEAVDLPDDEE